MGSSSYSDDAARFTRSARATKSVDDVFVNNKTRTLDPALDPMDLKVRESRDSAAHPESNAIMIMFDVTGSMGGIPKDFAMSPKSLPALMRLLTSKGYIQDPQICFGAIGDATSDRVPFQIGQFESGMEMDDWLTKIFLEGAGGGQNKESYELAFYAAARHTSIDCHEKRGKKGYLFTIGDECAYSEVKAAEVKRVFGADLQGNVGLADIIAEAQRKYEVFHIAVSTPSYNHGNHNFWKDLLGERALFLSNPEGVAELIATTIGACEGRDLHSIHADLVAAGSSPHLADAAQKAMVPFAAGSSLTKAGAISGDLAPIAGGGSSVRL